MLERDELRVILSKSLHVLLLVDGFRAQVFSESMFMGLVGSVPPLYDRRGISF
jgi:hypothetical protein